MRRSARLLMLCTRAHNRLFWRTPIAAFFGLVFPVLMLVLFSEIFGGGNFNTFYGGVTSAQFYTPGLAVYAAATATYTNIGVTLASRRDLGVLKRVRGTPMPGWAYLGGSVLSGVWIAMLATVLMLALGVAVYGVSIRVGRLPMMLLVFTVGSAVFATLGVALAAVARSASSAVPIANATILPLAFISDIFIPLGSSAPRFLVLLSDIFPLKHFGRAFWQAVDPASSDLALEWHHLGVLVLWMAAGAAVAARRFQWSPFVAPTRSDGRSRRSGRRGRRSG